MKRLSPPLLFSGGLLIMLAPFFQKAFEVDDPLFLWSARRILESPGDFFGFSVNWYGWTMPMVDVTKNPPLVCYFIALAASLAGWSEAALHAAFALPAVAAMLGTYTLARRMNAPAGLAATLLLASPGFLLCATTVMCDMTTTAFWIWAVVLWRDGMQREDARFVAAAGLLAGLAGLSKYFGLALLPLFAADALIRRRSPRLCATAFLVPGVMLLLFHLWAERLYGRSLLSEAVLFTSAFQDAVGADRFSQFVIGLSFTGGCAVPVLLLAHRLWPRRAVRLALPGAAAIAGFLIAVGGLGRFSLMAGTAVRWGIVLQLTVLVLGGIAVLVLAARETARRDADGQLLALWVFGTFAFAAFLNWTVNGRSVLPMLPAVAILAARRLSFLGFAAADPNSRETTAARIPFVAPVGAALILTLVVGWADSDWADSSRDAALRLTSGVAEPARIRFQGHWGFQYYMEQHGARPVDAKRIDLAPGEIVIRPTGNANIDHPLPGVTMEPTLVLEYVPNAMVATMNRGAGAGFYSDVFGPLPFAFGAIAPELYEVYKVTGVDSSAWTASAR